MSVFSRPVSSLTILTVAAVLTLASWHTFALLDQIADWHPFDTTNSYIPAARVVLADGWLSYFQKESALRISPLSALWFAMLDADPMWARTVHSFLSGACVILTALCAHQLSGRVAALAAGAAWALSPAVTQFASHALTEGPYFFLLLCWLGSAIAYVQTQKKHWLAVAFVFGGLCILMRSFPLYPMLLLLLMAAAASCLKQRAIRDLAVRIILLLIASVAIALAYMAANKLQHGVFTLATGGGGALYQGLHPHTSGFEAAHFNLAGDIEGTLLAKDHLTLAADQQLGKIARAWARERSGGEWVRFIKEKTFALVFHHDSDVRLSPALRPWRVVLFSFSVIGLWFYRKRIDVLLVAALGGLIAAQLVPVLHTARYSISALEPFLTLLGALGVAAAFRGLTASVTTTTNTFALSIQSLSRPLVSASGFVALGLVSVVAAFHHSALQNDRTPADVSMPTHTKTPKPEVILQSRHTEVDGTNGALAREQGWIVGYETVFAANYAVTFSAADIKTLGRENEFWSFDISVRDAENGWSCRRFELAYLPAHGSGSLVLTEPFSVRDSVRAYPVRVSATRGLSNVSPKHSGVLRVLAHCPPGSAFRVSNIAFNRSTVRNAGRKHVGLPPLSYDFVIQQKTP